MDETNPTDIEFFRALAESSDEVLFAVRVDGTVTYASGGATTLWRSALDTEPQGESFWSLIAEADRHHVRSQLLALQASSRRRIDVAFEVQSDGGSTRACRFEVVDASEVAALEGFLFAVRDLDRAVASAAELERSRSSEAFLNSVTSRFAHAAAEDTERELHQTLLEVASILDAPRILLWVLDDLGRMFHCADEFHAESNAELQSRLWPIPVNVAREIAPGIFGGGLVDVRPDGDASVFFEASDSEGAIGGSVTLVPMRTAGNTIGLLAVQSSEVGLSTPSRQFLLTVATMFATAISRRSSERAMAFQALHDPLTGLPNRSLLVDRLNHALARSSRNGENVTVMLIDLDGFKDVNDTLGHEAGDQLLKVISARLVDTLRDADSVARLGGDEFVAVAETALDEINAKVVAGRIVEVLRQPVVIGEQTVVVSGSIGLVVANAREDRSLDASSLLRKADIAMYRAKTAGRDRVEVFSDEMEERIRRRFELLDDLRRAIADGELIAWYQPIIDVASGQLTSYEALVRWIHPVRGIIAPVEFIELAEGSGIVHELGRSVLSQAVAQLSEWRAVGAVHSDVTISVNVSVRQLLSASFVELVRTTLDEHGLPASLLHLELTESVFAERAAVTDPLLRLRELGVRVSIDDFGTGYSSLSYLRDLPIDCLKIDRSFVQGLGCDRRDSALVGAVVGMAAELGLEVVAEGVETAEQLAQLERLGCKQAQGFLFGRPAPANAVGLLAQTLLQPTARTLLPVRP